jgi:hypothetical protein
MAWPKSTSKMPMPRATSTQEMRDTDCILVGIKNLLYYGFLLYTITMTEREWIKKLGEKRV